MMILVALSVLMLAGCDGQTVSPTPYNLSLMGNQSGYVPFIAAVNDNLMFGWFGNMMLISLFSILYITFFRKTNDSAGSIGAASFATLFASMLLLLMGLVSDNVVIIMWIVTALAAAALVFRE